MKQELKALLEKYIAGELTPAERRSLRDRFEDPASRLLMEELLKESYFSGEYALPEDEALGRRLDQLMAENMRPSSNPVIRRGHFSRRWIWAAAAVLLAIGTSMYFLLSAPQGRPMPTVAEAPVIEPGRQGAVLTLADGSQILLDTIENGVIQLQGGGVAKISNGTLLYDGAGHDELFNTMSTPKGRQFQVVLPDGTKVWLNAASSIRYPTVFKGRERMVELTGEAYFEVAQNTNQPFMLNVANRAFVEVLGTEFNVNAYENESSVNTTLINGAVRVIAGARDERRNKSILLKPGHQAMVMNNEDGGRLIVDEKADLGKALAWKNGLFYFENSTLREIMRQIERWYDIEVVFESGVSNPVFAGEMTRDLPLSGVLIALERSNIHYRMEGKKLIIFP